MAFFHQSKQNKNLFLSFSKLCASCSIFYPDNPHWRHLICWWAWSHVLDLICQIFFSFQTCLLHMCRHMTSIWSVKEVLNVLRDFRISKFFQGTQKLHVSLTYFTCPQKSDNCEKSYMCILTLKMQCCHSISFAKMGTNMSAKWSIHCCWENGCCLGYSLQPWVKRFMSLPFSLAHVQM